MHWFLPIIILINAHSRRVVMAWHTYKAVRLWFISLQVDSAAVNDDDDENDDEDDNNNNNGITRSRQDNEGDANMSHDLPPRWK